TNWKPTSRKSWLIKRDKGQKGQGTVLCPFFVYFFCKKGGNNGLIWNNYMIFKARGEGNGKDC
ncbi:MAG TPA: hypothetical protein PLE53_02985, partial [Bacillota bacterium]|nr:hypothetical protein [Bacillota bacterium]